MTQQQNDQKPTVTVSAMPGVNITRPLDEVIDGAFQTLFQIVQTQTVLQTLSAQAAIQRLNESLMWVKNAITERVMLAEQMKKQQEEEAKKATADQLDAELAAAVAKTETAAQANP